MKKSIFIILSLSISLTLNAQVSKTIAVSSGGLSSALTATEKSTVTNLTVTGTIDARDFKTMRDNMTVLSVINLNGVAISAYTGIGGTASSSSTSYFANTIPAGAFSSKSSLTTVIIPSSITTIDNSAFSDCTGLTSINIPSSVTSMGYSVFYRCSSLTAVTIPSSVTSITDSFWRCGALITVDVNNPNYSSIDGVLFNKNQTILIACPTSKTGSYIIPSSVTAIEKNAFGESKFTSVIIPSSVTSIGIEAFYGSALVTISIPVSVTSIGDFGFAMCFSLKSFIVKNTTPITFSTTASIFAGLNPSNSILYVPTGFKSAYQSANQWNTFTQIFEYTLSVSNSTVTVANEANSTASVELNSDTTWTVNSDKAWLTVSPTSGKKNSTLTFTASANPTMTPRTATITVTDERTISETIAVTQDAGVAALSVSATTASLAKGANSTASINVTSNTTWIATSDQAWLTVSPSTITTGNATLTFTAAVNPMNTTRTAMVTISATGVTPQTITVTQEAGTETGIVSDTKEVLCLYPNPVTDILYLSSVESVKRVKIINIEGRTISYLKDFSTNIINTSNLDKGVYLFYITTESGTFVKKIVKE